MILFRTALLLSLITAPGWWRETNSHAASRRGTAAYESKAYPAAVEAFQRADEIAPGAQSAFNRGTAEIAGGNAAAGATTLGRAVDDVTLAAEALFNRGNGALSAGAFDHAIRDYTESLRRAPGNQAAKRNLEIALRRRQQQKQEPARGGEGGESDREETKPSPADDPKKRPRDGEVDLEALLRSVEQQEQEELRRMKGRPARGRIGW